MRFALTREIELIWLRQLLLPLGLLFYCASVCVAIANWIGVGAATSGASRVISLALVGHLFAAVLLAVQGIAGSAILRRLCWESALEDTLERSYDVAASYGDYSVLERSQVVAVDLVERCQIVDS